MKNLKKNLNKKKGVVILMCFDDGSVPETKRRIEEKTQRWNQIPVIKQLPEEKILKILEEWEFDVELVKKLSEYILNEENKIFLIEKMHYREDIAEKIIVTLEEEENIIKVLRGINKGKILYKISKKVIHKFSFLKLTDKKIGYLVRRMNYNPNFARAIAEHFEGEYDERRRMHQ